MENDLINPFIKKLRKNRINIIFKIFEKYLINDTCYINLPNELKIHIIQYLVPITINYF